MVMTLDNEFASTKKRVRIFVYEFDGYYNGDPALDGVVDTSIKNEGGFFLILASVMVILSLLLLGLDLVISPITGLKNTAAPSETQIPTKHDIPSMETNFTNRDSLPGPREHFRESFAAPRGCFDARREPYGAAYHESSRQSVRRHYNSPASHETSFTTSGNTRSREYWL